MPKPKPTPVRKKVLVMMSPQSASGDHAGRIGECLSDALFFENLGVVYGKADGAGLERLHGAVAASDQIAGVPPMEPIRGLGSSAPLPNAPEIAWGVAKIQAPALWKQGLSGKGVLVAHLDTGVDGAHASLKPAIAHFAEFDLGGRPVKNAPIADSGYHGSHTAGIIAGRPYLGQQIGVAPGCSLASAMVIEEGDLVARVLAGVNWALNFPIRVLNASLGVKGYFGQYIPLLNQLRAKGVFPVFAVGNDGPGVSCSPANYPQAISVGAVDQAGAVDDQSSSQRFARPLDPLVPDLVMPGVHILSVNAGGGNFRLDSGTSMAAPHLAGLAALLLEAYPKATVDQLEEAIYTSCALEPGMLSARANRGLPDGVKALAKLHDLVNASQAAAGAAR